MTYAFIAEQCSDLPVAVCCAVMEVSTSGIYQRQSQPVTDAELDVAHAANTVPDIWTMSRRAYGCPRVRDELRLGMGRRCSTTQVERWMRACGAVGIHYPAPKGSANLPPSVNATRAGHRPRTRRRTTRPVPDHTLRPPAEHPARPEPAPTNNV